MDISNLDLVDRLKLEKKANMHGGIYHILNFESK